jgi:helix-turn-helix protein
MNEGTLGQNQRPCHTFEPGAPRDQAEQPAYIGNFESYVDEHVVARFIQLAPRRVLEMARRGEIPAHPVGRTRKIWRFRISEIDAHFSMLKKPVRVTMAAAVPGTQERKRLG